MNGKKARLLRKNCNFKPEAKREYEARVYKNPIGLNSITVKNKAYSPRALYQYSKVQFRSA